MNNFIVMSLHIINFIESSFQHKKNPKKRFLYARDNWSQNK